MRTKQEAIDLIKKFRSLSDNCLGIALENAKAGEFVKLIDHINEDVFMMFFDITEDDLIENE